MLLRDELRSSIEFDIILYLDNLLNLPVVLNTITKLV